MCDIYYDLLIDMCDAINKAVASGDNDMAFRLVNILSRMLFYINESLCKGCECCEEKDE